MTGTVNDPWPLSSLKPSEREIDAIQRDAINDELDSCSFVDFLQAADEDDCLDPGKAVVLYDLVKSVAFRPAGEVMLTHAAISIMLVKAFERYVQKYSQNRVNALLDCYANNRAEELAERGIYVDHSI